MMVKNCPESLSDYFLLLKETSGTPHVPPQEVFFGNVFQVPKQLVQPIQPISTLLIFFIAFHAFLTSKRSAFSSNLQWKTKLHDKTQIFLKYEFRLDRNTIFQASSTRKSHPSWAKINAQWDIKHDDGKNCQESLSDHFLLLKEASGTPHSPPPKQPE